MNLLLDTNAFLWFISGDERLSENARPAMEDLSNNCYVSIATLSEIAIKVSLGRLKLPRPFDEVVTQQIRLNGFIELSITPAHLEVLLSLPFHHRDPFDRLLAAQAKADGMTIVTPDRVLDAYEVKRLW